ncbi:hypothetical protein NQ318_002789 [Aromia moschata]|uniref:Ribosomal protein S13 n=1 Tax=Aromia moschata TaxID=1265417 RepID=A0AAV8XSR9_9CUCU|nr:hypothetical protein NQ318_002789 [Aromia moschata]
MEQRVNLKLLVKLGKTFTEAYAMLKRSVRELIGLNGLKRDVKRPMSIRALHGPQRRKRTKTLKNLVNQPRRSSSKHPRAC